MLALNAKPSTARDGGEHERACAAAGASSAPTAPHAAQPSICCGVQIPWPRKRFETSAASAPAATPAREPSVAPATIAITVTGCTPGHRGEQHTARCCRRAERRDEQPARASSRRPDSNHANAGDDERQRAEQRRERAVVHGERRDEQHEREQRAA